MKIYLIRHARPDILCTSEWCDYQAAQQYIHDFDRAPIENVMDISEKEELRHVKKVYCSTLNRSLLTAEALFGTDIEIIPDKKFIEFERKVIRLPILKLPVKWWLVTSRVLWALGLNNNGIETFRLARKRAKECAQHLAELSKTNPPVVLVAHGFLNKFIEWELRRLGWNVSKKGGIKHLGVTILENG